jgi:drug/metabolite transporter (DMT)-like permease
MLLNVIVDFIDRKSAYQSDYYALALWTTIFQFLLILPLVGLVHLMSARAFVYCALVGAFSAYARVPWFRALDTHMQTLSRLSPFVRLSSIMVLFGAYVLLGEPFSYSKVGGGLLMIAGSVLVTLDNPVKSVRSFLEYNHAAGLVLIYAASLASISVLYKYLLNEEVDIFSVYFFLKLFQAIAISIITSYNGTLTQSYEKIPAMRLFVFGRTIQTISALVYLLALRGLKLSVAEPIAALVPLVVLGIEMIGGRWLVNQNELQLQKVPTRTVSVRVASLVIVSLGLYLLYAS